MWAGDRALAEPDLCIRCTMRALESRLLSRAGRAFGPGGGGRRHLHGYLPVSYCSATIRVLFPHIYYFSIHALLRLVKPIVHQLGLAMSLWDGKGQDLRIEVSLSTSDGGSFGVYGYFLAFTPGSVWNKLLCRRSILDGKGDWIEAARTTSQMYHDEIAKAIAITTDARKGYRSG